MEFFANLPVACVNAAITYLFIMLFRDILNEGLDAFLNRKGFFHIGAIFVSVVLEDDRVPSYDQSVKLPSQATPNSTRYILQYFEDCICLALHRHRSHLWFLITAGLDLFKGVSGSGLHFI